MTEEFLHHVWKFRLYHPGIHLTTGEPVVVSHPGMHNTDSGPDFFNARVKIGDTLWAGNVEIHIRSSDWMRHRHHLDPAYDNIILHVVHHNDMEVQTALNQAVPTVELREFIKTETWKQYLGFLSSRSWIPCEAQLGNLDQPILISWMDRLLVERLERKSDQIKQLLLLSSNDWNYTFYRLLARNMGFKLNNEPFGLLSGSLSYQNLLRHADNLFQLESILFGQSGMLQGEFSDEYPRMLKKEYEFLSRKFSLTAMDGHLWLFMRIHPGNFPTIRLSQMAALIHKFSGLLELLLSSETTESFFQLFSVEASEYWTTHFRFDKPSGSSVKRLGREAIHLLLLNLVIPFLFTFGKMNGKPALTDRALQLLDHLEGENNSITRKWGKLGMDVTKASNTQSLLELKSKYCDNKKCLSCRIGNELLCR